MVRWNSNGYKAPGKDDGTPTWDGNPLTWDSYKRQVKWYVSGTKLDARRFVVGRLVPKLTGSAAQLVRRWNPDDFDREDGVKLYIDKLQASPLPRQPLQDAVVAFDKFFDLKRDPGEAMQKYLVREEEMYSVFSDAVNRLRVQEVERRARERERLRAAGNSEEVIDWDVDEVIDEDRDETEWFLRFVRGWRLLTKANITNEQRAMVIGDANGDLSYPTMARILRAGWDTTALSGSKYQNLHFQSANYADDPEHHANYDQEDWSEMWDENDALYYEDDWTEEQENPEYHDDEGYDVNALDDEDVKLTEQLTEAQALAMEANRTLAQARAAVAEHRRDRGFGKNTGKGDHKKGKGKGNNYKGSYLLAKGGKSKNGKGKGTRSGCAICGSAKHWWRQCPDAAAPGDCKGGGKGQTLGALEIDEDDNEIPTETLAAARVSTPETKKPTGVTPEAGVGMVDTGASAVAGAKQEAQAFC